MAVLKPILKSESAKPSSQLGLGRLGLSANGGYTASNELHGAGHPGVGPLDRVIMSLKSGIESEIEHALNTLTYYSCNEPELVRLDKQEFLGKELINFFIKPYQMILDNKLEKVTTDLVIMSLDALVTLRNAIQDIDNQQWLSQVKNFRKHVVEVLKLFVGWYYTNTSKQSYHLKKFNDLWNESFIYLLDLIDPLSCYYVDNNKQDPLFNQLLIISAHVKDRNVFMNTLKSITHLMYTSGDSSKPAANEESDVKTAPHNCIDNITDEHLEIYVNSLLVNDDELSYVILSFIKQYLTSDALHPLAPESVKESQLIRLRKLVQIGSNQGILHVLMKQLPILIVSNLPLLDQSKIPPISPLNLTKRSAYSGVPTKLPELPKQLYEIIVKFPEPLRATTWLRCCYEPYYPSAAEEAAASNEVTPGEVTQISLWKAYESQFEEVWKKSEFSQTKYPNILPAVDFIKNVSSAFPESDAKVVNIPSEIPEEAPKRKFIIKGIQPRQFAVSIDIGNYEALKKKKHPEFSSVVGNEDLPVGHVDREKFDRMISGINDYILSATLSLKKSDMYVVNFLSHDILDYIITELLEPDTDGQYKNIFRHYNIDWLPELIHSNPGLVESSFINSKWLLYLL